MKPTRPRPAQLRALADADPALADAMDRAPRFPGFPQPDMARLSYFAYLCKSIAYQQLAGKAAATIWGRVAALTPGPAPPRPAELLALPDDRLRGAGLSRNKMLALQDLARRVEERELHLPSLGRLADEDVIERLVQVRGIGVWSAQMFLMFRLGRLDVMPTGDLGVQEGLRLLDGLEERPSPKVVEARAECWAPVRSVAAWVLWRVVGS